MELYLITKDDLFEGESALLDQLVGAGVSTLHFRKPQIKGARLERAIAALTPRVRARTMLHAYETIESVMNYYRRYELGGVHLPERMQLRDHQRSKFDSATLSGAIHSYEPLSERIEYFDYLLMSPLFPTHAKPDAQPLAFDDFVNAYHQHPTKLVPLGGISYENAKKLKAHGIKRCAVKGAIWDAADPCRAVEDLCTV